MRTKIRHIPAQRAFTLIEMTVALTITVIVAGTLYSTLYMGLRSPASTEATLKIPRNVDVAMEMFGTDLQNSTIANGYLATIAQNNQNPARAGDFEGVQGTDDRGHPDDDVSFCTVSDSPQHLDANGEQKLVEYSVVTDSATNDHVLVRKVTRNLLAVNLPLPDEDVVCRGVEGFSLEYFNGSEWTADVWDSTEEDNTTPAAVRVTLVMDHKTATAPQGTYTIQRVFTLPCSAATVDPAVNTGVTIP